MTRVTGPFVAQLHLHPGAEAAGSDCATPAWRRAWQKDSHRALRTALGPRLAEVGPRPLRTSAKSVNWLTTSAPPPSSRSERSSCPRLGEDAQLGDLRRELLAALLVVSSGEPSSTQSPGPISPMRVSPTVTRAISLSESPLAFRWRWHDREARQHQARLWRRTSDRELARGERPVFGSPSAEMAAVLENHDRSAGGGQVSAPSCSAPPVDALAAACLTGGDARPKDDSRPGVHLERTYTREESSASRISPATRHSPRRGRRGGPDHGARPLRGHAPDTARR